MTRASLDRIEAVLESSGAGEQIEKLLPDGVRPRQLRVRTLLAGILLAIADDRPAHLTRVHGALTALNPSDRQRLGVEIDGHLLTYRQVEYTFSVMRKALGKLDPDGEPAAALGLVVDALVEASIPATYKGASSSLAVDWSDHESFARPPLSDGSSADPEASWGHRSGGPTKGELFFGYFLQAATMVRDEHGQEVPELVRAMLLSACSLDPVPTLVPVLERYRESVGPLGDVLADSGYAHRHPENWALKVRAMGGQLVMDLHPHDRGTKGTYEGAICFNGNLYCPATPPALFTIGPLARNASAEQIRAHDAASAELSRYKLGRISADDKDGYHRVMCPAEMGKLRCPAKASSLALGFDRPQVGTAPKLLPKCCSQATITVPPEVNAKTAQKHDYPSRAHRQSYARRTAVERSYSTLKDPASTDTTRGWCRVMGLPGITLLLVCAVVIRNFRVIDAFEAREADNQRRIGAGLPTKTRRRRRKTIDDLVATPP